MISSQNPEQPNSEEPEDQQDDEIIATVFHGSLKVFALIAILVGGIWLLNLKDNKQEPVNPGKKVPILARDSEESAPVLPFTDISSLAGVDFLHENGARGEKLLPETMGSGAVFADLDGDSDPDLLLASGRPWPWTEEKPIHSTVRMWINKGIHSGSFQEVTEQWNLQIDSYCTGMAVGDVDGDNDLDLFVATIGENLLLINDGGSGDSSRSFQLRDSSSGVAGEPDSWSTSSAFFDADGDADLDLFVCEYVRWSRQKDIEVDYRFTGVGRAYGPPTNFEGSQCRLLINDGTGNFEDVSEKSGIYVSSGQSPIAKALAVIPADLNGDGAIDVMVANDTTQNFLFMNTGNGTFKEVGVETGLAYDANGSATGAMGLDITDYRNDGSLGVAVANFSAEMTGLYRSPAGSQLFLDESVNEGIGPPSRKALSFGLLFIDVDLDGRQDLIQVNGHLEEEIATVQPGQEYRQSAQLFWNRGPGNGCFEEIVPTNTGDLGIPAVGRALACADIDGDGDLDLILTQAGGKARLLRNDQSSANYWIKIDPKNLPPGSWIEIEQEGRTQRRLIGQTRSYLSQCEKIITFGLGSNSSPPRIRFQPLGNTDWNVVQTQSVNSIYSLDL